MANRKAAMGFIFITMVVDIMGIGIIIPIMPELIMELTGGTNSEASVWYAWLAFTYAIMQFVFAPVLGGLSDQFGRRPVLLGSLFGFALDYIFMALAPTIWWLFVGRILSGLFGSSITTATAYVADVSTPEKKAQNFGMIGLAFGVGFIVGPAIGGFLGEYGARIPFYAAAIFTALNWLFGYFVLPESLSLEKRRKFNWKRANPVGSLMQFKKRPIVLGLAFSMFFIYVAAHATQSTWAFYTKEKFDWSPGMIGLSLTFIGFIVAVVQGGLIRIIIPRIGEKMAIYTGLTFYILGFLLFGLATEGWMMYVFIIPYALGGLAGPSLRGIMSNEVPDNEQGELQGGLTSMVNITTIIGPPLMAFLFAFYTSPKNEVYLPGAPFFLGALLSLICLFLARNSLMKHHN
jgi:MFS transporter, DHA1 family, tetracycline resistance protein